MCTLEQSTATEPGTSLQRHSSRVLWQVSNWEKSPIPTFEGFLAIGNIVIPKGHF